MADNTTLNVGTAGDVIATDDIGGVKHQQVKVEFGVDGTATPVTASAPLPVDDTSTNNLQTTGSIALLDGTVALALEGMLGCCVQVLGTWVGTISFQISPNGGTNYYGVECLNPANTSEVVSSTTTVNGIFIPLALSGMTHFQVKMTAYTSGTANIVITATKGALSFPIFVKEDGQTLPSYGIQIAGSDGTNLRFLRASNTTPAGTEYAMIVRNIPSGDDTVVGKAAHDAAVSGNPVRIAGKANQNEPAAVADGDVVDAWHDQQGRAVAVINFPPNVAADSTHGPKSVTLTATTDAAIVAAPGASLSVYVTAVACSNTSATKSRVDLKDGTTTRVSMMLAADGGGFVMSFDPPWKITANTALNGALGTAVTDVRVNVHYFVAA